MEQPPKYLESVTPAPKAERIEYPVSRRLERMRAFSKLLDSQFPLFGNFRIGIDPIIASSPVSAISLPPAFQSGSFTKLRASASKSASSPS